jgi:hypothetical protein
LTGRDLHPSTRMQFDLLHERSCTPVNALPLKL